MFGWNTEESQDIFFTSVSLKNNDHTSNIYFLCNICNYETHRTIITFLPSAQSIMR